MNRSEEEIQNVETEGTLRNYSVEKRAVTWHMIYSIISILLYTLDIVTDVFLIKRYLTDGHRWSLGLTILFIFLPSLVITIIGERIRYNGNKCYSICCGCLFFLISFEQLFFHFLCLYYIRVLRKHVCTTVEYKYHYEMMKKIRLQASLLGRLEALLKFLSNFILQTTLFFMRHNVTLITVQQFVCLQIGSAGCCLLNLLWHVSIHLLDLKIFTFTFGLLLYSTDVVSDILLAIQYMYNKDYLLGSITASFVLIASLWVTYRSCRRQENLPLNCLKNVIVCVPIVLFNIEPTIHILKCIRYSLLRRKLRNSNYGEQVKIHRALAAELKLYEAFIEAAPQLTLQVAIIMASLHEFKMNLLAFLQIVSIITSLFGLGFGIVACFSAYLFSYDKEKMSKSGKFFMFLWYFPSIMSRIISMGAVASIFPLYTFATILIHWLISVLIWLRSFGGFTKIKVISEAFLLNLTYIFSPEPTDTNKEIIWTSAILFLENIIATAIWTSYTWNKIKTSIFLDVLVCVNIFGSIVGNAVMFFFLGVFADDLKIDKENETLV